MTEHRVVGYTTNAGGVTITLPDPDATPEYPTVAVSSNTTGRAVTTGEHLGCPFCGSIPTEMDGYDCDPPIFWVECSQAVETNCIAGPQRESPEAAWQAWDTRPAAAAVTALLEEVLSECGKRFSATFKHVSQPAVGAAWDDYAADVRERLTRALAGPG